MKTTAASGTRPQINPRKDPATSAPVAAEVRVTDPFVHSGFGPVLKKGPHAGEPLDTDAKRSARLLSPAEAARYHPAKGELLIADFEHDGKFYVARVPVDAVKQAIFQVQHFPSNGPIEIGSHNQLRFVFEKGQGVTLEPQQGGKPIVLEDFIFSVEALHAKGQKPFDAGNLRDLKRGATGHFATVYRALSTSERRSEMVGADGKAHRVEEHLMALEPAHAQTFLRALLADASRAGLERPFNTLTRNCTTELFHILDKTTRASGLAAIGQAMVPGSAPQAGVLALKARGLLPAGSRLPDFP